jgi:predicted TIM-barrel fold metal-dependent hydrolase
VVRGLKLVPHGFAPDAACLTPVYALCATARLPILFHCGIFISGRCSHDCRPAAFEAVRAHPDLVVVLAHMGWPWTDEAIAVALMDPLRGARPQILLDTSPGTPPVYRRDAMTKAFQVLGSELLLFGSDRFLPVDGRQLARRLHDDVALWRAAGASDAELGRFLAGNARRVFAARSAKDTERATGHDRTAAS